MVLGSTSTEGWVVAVVVEARVLLDGSVVATSVLTTSVATTSVAGDSVWSAAELGGMVIELCAHPCAVIATRATAAIRAPDLAIIRLTLTGAVAPLGQRVDDAISCRRWIERDGFAVTDGSIGSSD